MPYQAVILILTKSDINKIKIICGGRWVIDRNYDWIKNKMLKVDFFSTGCPDENIHEILNFENWYKYKSRCTGKAFSQLDYTLLNNFSNYQPSIEVARGCGFKCDFCLEKEYPYIDNSIKTPAEVIIEANKICTLYMKKDLNFYFEASIFNPTQNWAEDFSENYKKTNSQFSWRFNSRVDTLNEKSIKILAYSG